MPSLTERLQTALESYRKYSAPHDFVAVFHSADEWCLAIDNPAGGSPAPILYVNRYVDAQTAIKFFRWHGIACRQSWREWKHDDIQDG